MKFYRNLRTALSLTPLVLLLFFAVQSQASAQNEANLYQWLLHFGGSAPQDEAGLGDMGGSEFQAVAKLPDGYVAVGYVYAGSLGYGDWSGITPRADYYGSHGVIVKFNNQGKAVWKRVFEGVFTDVVVHRSRIAVVGQSTVNGEGDWANITPPGKYRTAGVLWLYDFNGNLLSKEWVVPDDEQGTGYSGDNWFYAVAPFESGYVAVGSTPATGRIGSIGLVTRFSSEGKVMWTRSVGANPYTSAMYGVAGAADAIYAVGMVEQRGIGSGDWSGLPAVSGTEPDAAIVKLGADGQLMWARNFGGSGYDNFRGVALDANDQPVAVGNSSTASFGNRDWTGVGAYDVYKPNSSRADAVIVGFDATGSVMWKNRIGGAGYDTFESIARSGSHYIVTGISHVESFDTGSYIGIPPKGTLTETWSDAVIAALDSTGHLVHAASFGGRGLDSFEKVTVDGDSAVVAGFSDAASFGTGDWAADASKGFRDAMLVQYPLHGLLAGQADGTASKIVLNKKTLTLANGSSEQLIASRGGMPQSAQQVRWLTSDSGVVSVVGGLVTSVGIGPATITVVSADNATLDTCDIIVTGVPTRDINLWALSSLIYLPFDQKSHGDKHLSDFSNSFFGNFTYIKSLDKATYMKETIGGFRVDQVRDLKSSSLFAVSFYDLNNGIVIAYRGSADLTDWLGNAKYTFGDAFPEQFYDAWQFYREVKAANPGKNIILTGHSLGGALAAFVSMMEDVKAVTFDAPSGLIIDLAYFINANYADHFNGIDKWKFTNHYNPKDIVGKSNAGLYDSIAREHNQSLVPILDPTHNTLLVSFENLKRMHDLEAIVTLKNQQLSLSPIVYASSYLSDDQWLRNVSVEYQNSYTPAYSYLQIDADRLNTGTRFLAGFTPDFRAKYRVDRLDGRLMLAKSAASSAAAPGGYRYINLPTPFFESKQSIVFTGGNNIVIGTNNRFGEWYYLSDTGAESIYGKGGNDTYVIPPAGAKRALIVDTGGSDVIYFKHTPMSSLSLQEDANYYYIRYAGGSSEIRVDKRHRQGAPILVKDANSTTRAIHDIPVEIAFGRQSLLVYAPTSDSGASGTDTDGTPTGDMHAISIAGTGLTVELYGPNDERLGVFTNDNDKVEMTDYAFVYMRGGGDRPGIDIDLTDDVHAVKVRSDGAVRYLTYSQSSQDQGTIAYDTGELHLADGAILTVDYRSDSLLDGFAITRDGQDSPLVPIVYRPVDSLSADVDEISLHVGQEQTIALDFAPEHVISTALQIEIHGDQPGSVRYIDHEDGTVTIMGAEEGVSTLTIKAVGSPEAAVDIAVTVLQDGAPALAAATADGAPYVGGSWATTPVTVQAILADGYDLMFMSVQFGQYEAADSLTVSGEGEVEIAAYAVDSATGKRTAKAVFPVMYDGQPPEIAPVAEGEAYYIDRRITIHDKQLLTAAVNGVDLTEQELADGRWIQQPGEYTATGLDAAGRRAEVRFAMLEWPDPGAVQLAETEAVQSIRQEFEREKYKLPQERRTELEARIYALERAISRLHHESSADNRITSFAIENQAGDASIDEDSRLIEVYVYESASLQDVMPMIGLPDGATLAPSPLTPRDYRAPVVYTVTAANGDTAVWTIRTVVLKQEAKPVLQSVAVSPGTMVLVFDDAMDAYVRKQSVTMLDSGEQPTASSFSFTVNGRMISLQYDTDMSPMPADTYSISFGSEALRNTSGVYMGATIVTVQSDSGEVSWRSGEDPATLTLDLNLYMGQENTPLAALLARRIDREAANSAVKGLTVTLKQSPDDAGRTYAYSDDIWVVQGDGALAQLDEAGRLTARLSIPDVPRTVTIVEIVGGSLKPLIIAGFDLHVAADLGETMGVQGDFNGDGQLTDDDYERWLALYKKVRQGTASAEEFSLTDLSRDGIVNNIDFSVWLLMRDKI